MDFCSEFNPVIKKNDSSVDLQQTKRQRVLKTFYFIYFTFFKIYSAFEYSSLFSRSRESF